ncbi:sigma-70 family RNA polymerase sigma factor [Flammeovirgaceae bacterium SG7u.111]|nr:sigma-70 family RNA polymerase sigma factor [Flammeovirgaceae bacterium SG7u.132]WPO37684.1 sigma-70 family RNA polymerase sigma factor [Flammeovirgaceae bacterium SG7u.111]
MYYYIPRSENETIAISSAESDRMLWSAFKAGKPNAFAQLYDLYFDVLYNYGKQFGLSNTDLEDTLQDFFIDLNKNKSNCGEVLCVKPYLLKSFRRRVVKTVKKKRALPFSIQISDKESFPISLDAGNNYMDFQLNQVQKEYLQQVFKKLSKRQREAIYHFYYEDLSYAETADIMGLSSAKSARNLIYQSISCMKGATVPVPEWLFILFIISCL